MCHDSLSKIGRASWLLLSATSPLDRQSWVQDLKNGLDFVKSRNLKSAHLSTNADESPQVHGFFGTSSGPGAGIGDMMAGMSATMGKSMKHGMKHGMKSSKAQRRRSRPLSDGTGRRTSLTSGMSGMTGMVSGGLTGMLPPRVFRSKSYADESEG